MKTYKKDADYSYALGAFPAFELIKNRPDKARALICHEKLLKNSETQTLLQAAREKSIPVMTDSRLCEKLSPKENIFVIGVFDKYESELAANQNHIMLVNPSDMGNLGTIMRTALGFGFLDLAVVGTHADFFNPKVVRSSMGSFFSLRVQEFESFDEYATLYKNFCYPFMLDAKTDLADIKHAVKPCTLIFGNEASGLDLSYLKIGTPLKITHSGKIDSLNLPVAAAIAMYKFFA